MLERILIVGLGSIGKRHARLARQLLPAVRVMALRRPGASGAAEHVDGCVTTVADALKFQPQAAVIAGPASQHLEVALALARAGVHLLVEKPLAHQSEGVPELIETCGAQGRVLMTGYNLRFLPSLQRFRELLQEGRVGRVISVRAEVGQFLPSWRPGADYRQSVSARRELGGGVLLELSHEIDYLRWLFGEVEWVSAVVRKQSALEIDVEDTAHLVLGLAGGAAPVALLSMDFVRHDTTRVCTAIGESGSLRWNAIAGTVEVFEAGGSGWSCLSTHAAQRDESYIAEWRHFLGCIDTGSVPLISGQDGLAVLKIIESARVSATAGAIARVDSTHSSGELRWTSSH